MSVIDRFFGRNESSTNDGKPTANNRDNPLALTVLFSGRLAIDTDALTRNLRAYHRSMRGASVELAPEIETPFGLVGWNKHVVKMVGFNGPMVTVESCVAPSHYPEEVKDRCVPMLATSSGTTAASRTTRWNNTWRWPRGPARSSSLMAWPY